MIEPGSGLRVALAQVNPTVGDLDGNSALIADAVARAREAGAGLVVTPELCLPGYPAEDLYLKAATEAPPPGDATVPVEGYVSGGVYHVAGHECRTVAA